MELDSGKLRDAAVSRSTIRDADARAKPFSARNHNRLRLSRPLCRCDEGRHRVDRSWRQPSSTSLTASPHNPSSPARSPCARSWRYFPARTVFLAVVDPGVGTARAPIAIETRAGARFVGPDNGLLWLAANQAGIKRIVKLTSLRHRLTNVSATFHGRDIFAPAAAYLWRGASISALGPALRSIDRGSICRLPWIRRASCAVK